jgi:pre-60S factor REI1
MTNEESLTSTTAPGKIFSSRAALAEHYRSDWHRYNLKRKEAGLPVLSETDFQIRLQAAQALQLEKKQQQQQNHKKKKHSSAAATTNHWKPNKPSRNPDTNDKTSSVYVANDSMIASIPTTKKMEMETETIPDNDKDPIPSDSEEAELERMEEMQVEIDPRQSLFDRHISDSVESNVAYMQFKYGFFVPDQEYLIDMEGLIGYCHEKIQIGKTCLYCQRAFGTPAACRNHMTAVGHTKLRYEANMDLDEFDVFYDFTKADQEFLLQNNYQHNSKMIHNSNNNRKNDMVEEPTDNEDNMNEDDDEWEDISEDSNACKTDSNNAQNDDDDDDLWEGYKQHIDQLGMGSLFEVTALGELVFPDGRVIGHRNLKRYYKQRISTRETSEAVLAARRAAGERLYGGRVYQIGYGTNASSTTAAAESEYDRKAMVLSKAGIAPGTVSGRAGKGILVPTNGSGVGYSQISMYRFRAAVQRQRRGEIQGKKIYEKTKVNINRMDKKHNRLMNGVSVAHAAR